MREGMVFGKRRSRIGWLGRLWLAAALMSICGCGLLFLAPIERISLLAPQPVSTEGYAVGEEGSITYEIDDLQVVVEPLSDAALNRLFPEESSLGEYSINPYTFGDYVDPEVGYVRNRFTVFRITVHNRGFAKVELNPLRSLLTTDRKGEVLQAYGILAGAAERTFEGYYRARRRPSGNEYYRFNMRMGIVRSNNYGVGEKIFKGESYGGFLVFDPLDDAVRNVRLTLRDFILKFNAFEMPLETVDLAFDFQRRMVEREGREGVEETGVATAARLRSPSAVSGNATGDGSRDPGTIDARVGEHLEAVNDCFATEFLAGTAAEGQLDVRLGVDAEGRVRTAAVVRSTVVRDAVGQCVQDLVKGWEFGPTDIPVALLAGDEKAGPEAYMVEVTCFFEFIDVRGSR
jgi:hypothetical protein